MKIHKSGDPEAEKHPDRREQQKKQQQVEKEATVKKELLGVPWTAMRSNQSILTKDQSWVFIGGTDVEAETPILWPPDAKS